VRPDLKNGDIYRIKNNNDYGGLFDVGTLKKKSFNWKVNEEIVSSKQRFY
jgi:hypothetical protein